MVVAPSEIHELRIVGNIACSARIGDQTTVFIAHSAVLVIRVVSIQRRRVEVEDTSNTTNDLVSGLELQLRINESLGRNTVILTGEKNGRHRVLFIQ